ncbi:peptide chain release factor 3 [Furfurilactobacillus rossiae]|nr:peptide chain release factor 3 [Furfurilactobacillus rossiae]QFR67975.1 peptide chain release factor 3 [Furfurilactobacillus rossiae]
MKETTLTEEINKRRTFAIISHPDAGKTTITEQMLLLSKVIREAGSVKGRKTGKYATSDWMEIEKQRGISVTSSVMQFDYEGKRINILDTPGHEDFSEDTYRTLMAVDSAVMVIDSAKGIEPQTRKLFKICKMRGIPIFTFINKLDRDGREPMDLLSEIEDTLNIETCPMNWPIGMGKGLKGLYDIYNNRVALYNRSGDKKETYIQLNDSGDIEDDSDLKKDSIWKDTLDEVELIKSAGNKLEIDKIMTGDLTPVFFGSALANFGVEDFLETYLKYAPTPADHRTDDNQIVRSNDDRMSGFVFKIQANMNANHRDRIAFVRLCSGEFRRGMDVTLNRTQRRLRLNNSTQFMAEDRESVQTAVSGDIIGLYDTGNFQIGDTIYEGKDKLQFEKLPQFTPEIFVQVTAKNVMKQKSFHKGIEQLVQEGAIQLFRSYSSNDYILGVVGQLQLEVFQFRMKNEYNSDVIMTSLGTKIARWVDPEQLDESAASSRNMLVKDRNDQPLFLFENRFAENWFAQKYPDVKLTSRL